MIYLLNGKRRSAGGRHWLQLSALVVLLPALACLAFLAFTYFSVPDSILHFDVCSAAPSAAQTAPGAQSTGIKPAPCLWSRPPADAETQTHRMIDTRLIPEIEIRNRYYFFATMTAFLLSSVILLFACLHAVGSATPIRNRIIRIGRRRVLYFGHTAGTILALSAMATLVVWLLSNSTDAVRHSVTTMISLNVLDMVPWAAPATGSGPAPATPLSVHRHLAENILPLVHAQITLTVAIFVLCAAVMASTRPYTQLGRHLSPPNLADHLFRQNHHLRRLAILASISLALGIAAFRYYADWPVSLLEATGYQDAAHRATTLNAGIVMYWSVICTTVILVTYLTASVILNHYAMRLHRGPIRSTRARMGWARDAGLHTDLAERAKLFASIFLPLLIGSSDTIIAAFAGAG